MNHKSINKDPLSQRDIRVFVSSTFRDMHAERDELVKRVFPQLRKLCESRGVTWGEVDLRWGITQEQSERGEVLPICLAEIKRCRPYFIGLLGDRYGWIPDTIPQELIEQEPWLSRHLRHSVTELEILHGVLNNPAMAGHAYFYFRDPSFIDTLPAEGRQDFLEHPTPKEVAELGEQEAVRRAESRKEKLNALKNRIRESGFPTKENYLNQQELGEMVLADMTEIINQLYPEDSEPAPLDRDAVEHEVFAQSRAQVYIGRQEYFDKLNEHAQSDDSPLVILGESGSGKSALLANWALKYRSEHPDDFALMHFIGGTPYSADWAAMLRRIMGEFKRHFDIQQEIPDKPDELRAAFAKWLHIASEKGRAVIILDALNQLEDHDSAPDLVWLPPVLPGNIRLILSTLSGRSLDDIRKRGWQTLIVTQLEPEERKSLIQEYLAQYTKKLSSAFLERIVFAEQTSNPLYLRALLDELRIFGVHEQLDKLIAHYLNASTIPELYKKILKRYEEDYERDRPGLVRDAMSLLWAARRGLSESELLEMLGTESGPLAHATWSPLHLAAESSLVGRSGLIGFGHDYLREAVQQKYLHKKEIQNQAHIRLANYLENQPLGARKVDELPWQLCEANSWDRLANLLSDPPFFAAAWEKRKFDIKTYWAILEVKSSYRVASTYFPLRSSTYLKQVAEILFETANYQPALQVHESILSYYQTVDPDTMFAQSLTQRASILATLGKKMDALKSYDEAIDFLSHRNNAKDKEIYQACLQGKALILFEEGAFEEALGLLETQEAICLSIGFEEAIPMILRHQAMIRFELGDYTAAIELVKESEHLALTFGDLDAQQRARGEMAIIKVNLGEREEALSMLHAQEIICRKLGNTESLVVCLLNQGSLYLSDEIFNKASELFLAAEVLSKDKGLEKHCYSAILGRAAALVQADVLDVSAVKLADEAVDYFRRNNFEIAIGESLFLRGRMHSRMGNLELCLDDFKEAEEIASKAFASRKFIQHLVDAGEALLTVIEDVDTNQLPDEVLSKILAKRTWYAKYATDFFRRATTLKPEIPSSWSGYGLAQLKSGNLNEATFAFRRALLLHPESWRLKLQLAKVLIQRPFTEKNITEAITLLERVMGNSTSNESVFVMMIQALIQNQNFDRIVKIFSDLVQAFPEQAQLHYDIFNSIKETNKQISIRNAFKLKVESRCDSDHHFDWYGLGLAEQALYEQQNALNAFEMMVKKAPSWATGYYCLATAYFAMGMKVESRKNLEKAISLSQTLAEPRFCLGVTDYREGNLQNAKTLLLSYLSIVKDYNVEYIREAHKIIANIDQKNNSQ